MSASLLFIFRKKACSACLFGYKRPHNGTLSLPPFCESSYGANISMVRHRQKKRDTKRCPFSFVFLLKVSAIATEVNSRVAALTGTSPSAATSEWTLLHSGYSAKEKPSYPPSFLLFAKKARSARLFACKRAHVGSLPLPPFCGLEKQKIFGRNREQCER